MQNSEVEEHRKTSMAEGRDAIEKSDNFVIQKQQSSFFLFRCRIPGIPPCSKSMINRRSTVSRRSGQLLPDWLRTIFETKISGIWPRERNITIPRFIRRNPLEIYRLGMKKKENITVQIQKKERKKQKREKDLGIILWSAKYLPY